jgi:hypothetical protein
MEFLKKRIICNTCNRDLTDMGLNYENHLRINNHQSIREEYMLYKK